MIKMLTLHWPHVQQLQVEYLRQAQYGDWPPSLMSTLLLLLCQEYARYPLLILTIRSIESFRGGTFKSIKYRNRELNEEKFVI
ncbi:hypothetical protein P3S68_015078 [Capsicum galapagoense]